MLRKTMGLLLALPVAALAAPTVKPGLWELAQTLNGDSDTDYDCVTPEEARDPDSFRKGIPRDCMLSDVKEGANSLSFAYRCDSATQTGSGRFDLKVPSPTQYQMSYQFDGQMRMAGKTMPMVMKLESRGRWLAADCGEYADD